MLRDISRDRATVGWRRGGGRKTLHREEMELMEERPSHASHASTGTFLDEDSRYHDSMQSGLVKCKGRICKVLVQADLEHAFF